MNRSMFNSARILLSGLFLLCAVGAASAQFKAGIQGTVTDSGGGLVPEAKMTLTNKETGKTQETTSSSDGFYQISGLAPGQYKLTVEKSGYKQKVSTMWQSMPRQFEVLMWRWNQVTCPRVSPLLQRPRFSWALRMQTKQEESAPWKFAVCLRSAEILMSCYG